MPRIHSTRHLRKTKFMSHSQCNQSGYPTQWKSDGQVTIAPSGNVYWSTDKMKRFIGKLASDTFYCERIPERHLHRKTNAYGFNYELMKRGGFSNVLVKIPCGETLYTTRETILKHGFFLKFQSFEKQIFLKLSDFGETNIVKVIKLPEPPQYTLL